MPEQRVHEGHFDSVATLCECSAAYEHPHGTQEHELHDGTLLRVGVHPHMHMSSHATQASSPSLTTISLGVFLASLD